MLTTFLNSSKLWIPAKLNACSRGKLPWLLPLFLGVPRGLRKSGKLLSFLSCYLECCPAESRPENTGEHAGISVANKPIGTTRWYHFFHYSAPKISFELAHQELPFLHWDKAGAAAFALDQGKVDILILQSVASR